MATITLDQPNPAYGDVVTFTVTGAPKPKGNTYPMIDLWVFQDVNADSVVDETLLGPDIVQTALQVPDATFPLGDAGGITTIWSNRGGGPAEAQAHLVLVSWKGGHESAQVLASTSFSIDG